jgi:hypothetical protein
MLRDFMTVNPDEISRCDTGGDMRHPHIEYLAGVEPSKPSAKPGGRKPKHVPALTRKQKERAMFKCLTR